MGTVTFRCEEQKALSIKLDQCIEQTVNREQKCRERIYAFSTSEGTVQRWTLISHCVAQCVAILRNDLRCSKTNRKPKDLGKSRIEFSNKSADRAYDVLKQGRNPFDERFANQHLFGKRGYTSNTWWHKRPQNRGRRTRHILERSTKI